MSMKALGVSKAQLMKELDFGSVLRYVRADDDEVGVSQVQRDIFKILHIKCLNFGETLTFDHEFYPINYQITSKANATFVEASSFFEPCYRALNFYEFYFLLISILEERKVLFVSENLQLLTSTM